MSDKKLMILGIVAALMVVLTAGQSYLSKMKAPSKAPQGDAYLIQGLDPGKIAFIEVGKGENPVQLVRRGNSFVVANKEDYPALTSKINDLLTSCRDIRTVGLVTSNPANHESLHVTEEKAQNVVKFLGEDEKIITGLVIGTSRLPELQIVGTSAHAQIDIASHTFTGATILVVGNETRGMSRWYRTLCDTIVGIPMRGSASSLNVACATTAILYEIQRQRMMQGV